ncbi:MAG: HAMP domain-containing histidine kinase [Chloroflexi bacterium]|nr:HAMP domain-containing histidine kinase [Chloroflexota bacterium]
MLIKLRTLALRYSLPLTVAITLVGGAVVIALAITLGSVLHERNPLTLLGLGITASAAILSLRVALDIFFDVLAEQAGVNRRRGRRDTATNPKVEQAERVDELVQLNTQLEALNQDLKQTKDQIERLDSVKTDFITIASHELRTPLAQMRGYSDIIDALNESGSLDKERLAGLASNLRKATERMEELIGAMLDTSQLDVNAMDLRYQPTTIETVVRMAIDPLADAVRERKISLRAVGLSGLPPMQGDLQRLVQAFRNVIVNAVKFTPDGGRIEIKSELAPGNGHGPDCIHVVILDTGVGIASENLELIFHKFYRAYDPSRHSTGAYKFMGAGPGLGLTIARGIILGHGGSIWAESPGHDMNAYPGSRFHVMLPMTPPEDARRILPFGVEEEKSAEEAETPTAPNGASQAAQPSQPQPLNAS